LLFSLPVLGTVSETFALKMIECEGIEEFPGLQYHPISKTSGDWNFFQPSENLYAFFPVAG